MVFFGKLRFAVRKNLSLPIFGLFGPNLDLFGSNISVKLVFDLGLDLSIVIVYIF